MLQISSKVGHIKDAHGPGGFINLISASLCTSLIHKQFQFTNVYYKCKQQTPLDV